MLYFANPSTPDVRAAMSAGLIGCIETPKQGNRPVAGAVWCADNGCFGKGYPGDEAWLSWLAARADRADSCLFATAPDVVGDAAATLERSLPWLPKIRALGFPAALVAQNGLESLAIPWDSFDALFLGGSPECIPCGHVFRERRSPKRDERCPKCGRQLTEWKLGPHASQLAAEAKRRGKWVHMGRVNSLRRLRYADDIGCDSADGTFLAFGPDANLPRVLRWTRDIHEQPSLLA